MFRLAHISDVHLGPLSKIPLRQLASKRITGYVNWRVSRHRNHGGGIVSDILADIAAQNPAHIAITGDLINLGLDSEIAQATEWLTSVGEPDFVSVVPGNHDAYVPGAFSRMNEAWRPWMEGDQRALQPPHFPYMRTRGGVALIGVSSARASAPFMATGYFRHRQALALAALLEEAKRNGLCRVIMIHHPPVRRAAAVHKRLVGISHFQKAVRDIGAELVLHGHTHLPTLAWIDGKDGKVPVVGVAAAGQAPGGLRPPAQFNLLDIDGSAGDWRINLTRRGLGGPAAGIGEISSESLTPAEQAGSDTKFGENV